MITWQRRPLLGLDTETTGTNVETDRIVTCCVVRFCGGRPTEPRSWVSDVGGIEIPAEATAVHGVTTEAARAAGRPAAAVVAEVTDAVAEAVTAGIPVVAINASFDLTILDREARRYGVTPLVDRVTPCVIDPRVLDKRVDRYRRGGRTLTDLCRHYLVALEDAHTADADAIAACEVAWKIANRHPWLARMSTEELHAEQVQWAREQAEGLRDYFTRTPGKEERAASVRPEWPLIPAPRGGGSDV